MVRHLRALQHYDRVGLERRVGFELHISGLNLELTAKTLIEAPGGQWLGATAAEKHIGVEGLWGATVDVD